MTDEELAELCERLATERCYECEVWPVENSDRCERCETLATAAERLRALMAKTT